MPYTVAAQNLMLDAVARGKAPPAAGINAVSLHTAKPNETGSNEVSGGDYARQAIAWGAPASGAIDDSSNGIPVPVPGGTTVKFVGFWQDNAGTPKFMGWEEVEEESFGGDGFYTVTNTILDLQAV